MHLWEIHTANRTLWARGTNWLVAAGHALDQLGVPAHKLQVLVVEAMDDEGAIRARDPVGGLEIELRPARASRTVEDEPPTEQVEPQLTEADSDVHEEETMRVVQPPDDTSPERATMLIEPPTALPEKLFDRGSEISDANDVEGAAKRALDILLDYVPVQSGTVLYASINDTDLRFVATSGRGTDELLDRRIPFGQGIAGWCFQTGDSVLLHDLAGSQLSVSDSELGDSLPGGGALLATPIIDEDGQNYGCIELQHPEDRFLDWHVQAAQEIANQLASFCRSRSVDPF